MRFYLAGRIGVIGGQRVSENTRTSTHTGTIRRGAMRRNNRDTIYAFLVRRRRRRRASVPQIVPSKTGAHVLHVDARTLARTHAGPAHIIEHKFMASELYIYRLIVRSRTPRCCSAASEAAAAALMPRLPCVRPSALWGNLYSRPKRRKNTRAHTSRALAGVRAWFRYTFTRARHCSAGACDPRHIYVCVHALGQMRARVRVRKY